MPFVEHFLGAKHFICVYVNLCECHLIKTVITYIFSTVLQQPLRGRQSLSHLASPVMSLILQTKDLKCRGDQWTCTKSHHEWVQGLQYPLPVQLDQSPLHVQTKLLVLSSSTQIHFFPSYLSCLSKNQLPVIKLHLTIPTPKSSHLVPRKV